MLKWLTKSTIELRVATEDEADELHKQMLKETADNGWVLNSWTETKKERKVKGEVEETWIQIKYCIIFSDPKDPTVLLNSIDYNLNESVWESDM